MPVMPKNTSCSNPSSQENANTILTAAMFFDIWLNYRPILSFFSVLSEFDSNSYTLPFQIQTLETVSYARCCPHKK